MASSQFFFELKTLNSKNSKSLSQGQAQAIRNVLNKAKNETQAPENSLGMVFLGHYGSHKDPTWSLFARRPVASAVIGFVCERQVIKPSLNLFCLNTSDSYRFLNITATILPKADIVLACITNAEEIDIYNGLVAHANNPGLPLLFVIKEEDENRLAVQLLNKVILKADDTGESLFARIVNQLEQMERAMLTAPQQSTAPQFQN